MPKAPQFHLEVSTEDTVTGLCGCSAKEFHYLMPVELVSARYHDNISIVYGDSTVVYTDMVYHGAVAASVPVHKLVAIHIDGGVIRTGKVAPWVEIYVTVS